MFVDGAWERPESRPGNSEGKLFATAISLESERLEPAKPKPRKENKVRGSSQSPLEAAVTEMETLVTAVAICGLTRVCRLLTPETHDAKQCPASMCDAEEWHPAAIHRMPIMPNTLAAVLRIAETAGLKPEKTLTCGGTDFRAENTPFSLHGAVTMFYSGTAPEHEVYAAVFCCIAKHLMADTVIDDLHLSGAVTGMTVAGMHLPSVMRRMYEIAAAHRKHTLLHGFSSIVPLLHFSTAPLPCDSKLSAECPSSNLS